jgi:hypothetical protein
VREVTAADVVAVLEADEAPTDLISALQTDTEAAERVVIELAGDRRFFVRQWVALEVASLLGERAVPILLRLARDRNEDVRMDAVNELVALEPVAARQLAPALRRRLRSRDIYEPIVAMRALMVLGDAADAAEMRAAAEVSEYPFHGLVAGAYALALEGDDEELARRIEGHDHDAMPWLTVAARHRATPLIREALARCAERAGDECANACAETLAECDAHDS